MAGVSASWVVGVLIANGVACTFVARGGSGGGIDAEVVDAPDPSCDVARCVAAGGTCLASGHCEIVHATSGKVTCPDRLYCDIRCLGTQLACIDGVDCAAAAGCDIVCGAGGPTGTSAGDTACSDGDVRCPDTGPCNVTCTGEYACRNRGVKCGNGRCDVHCLGSNACDVGVTCNASLDCRVECQGEYACRNGGVVCGAGTCSVECNGTNACQNGACTTTPTRCDFSCCGTAACGGPTAVCAGCTRDATCS